MIREGECGMAIKARMTEEGLLIPREVVERALGEGLDEVEIFEKPGQLLISPAGDSGESGRKAGPGGGEDPILALGKNPVEGGGASDASVNHDRYLYTGG